MSTVIVHDPPEGLGADRWWAKAKELAELLEQLFEWDDRIKLSIHGQDERHTLSLEMIGMHNKRYGIAVELEQWLFTREQAVTAEVADLQVLAAFDQLVRAAMYGKRT